MGATGLQAKGMGAFLTIPAVVVAVVVTVAVGYAVGAGVLYATLAIIRSVLRQIPIIRDFVPDEPPTEEEIAQARREEEKRKAAIKAAREAELKEQARPKTMEDATTRLAAAEAAVAAAQDAEKVAAQEAKASGMGFQRVGELRQELAKKEDLLKEAKEDLKKVQADIAQKAEGGSGDDVPSKSSGPAEFTSSGGQSQAKKVSSDHILQYAGLRAPRIRMQYESQQMPSYTVPPRAFNLPNETRFQGKNLRSPAVARRAVAVALKTALRRL